MLSIIDFLRDLTNPALAFLPRAILVTCVAACVCAVVGCHVVLRGMSFIGDAVAHSVFPGLAIAFVCSGSLVLGGTLAGVGTAVLVALLSQNRRLKEDSIIGVLFVGAFGLGLVIISWAPGYAGSLQDFLFGSLTGIPASEVPFVLIASAVIVGVFAFFHKEVVAVSLDRESARVAGLPVMALDLLVYVSVAGAVVISVQIIGNILVLALLITPAASARLLTNSLGAMIGSSLVIGVLSSLCGIYLSWSLDLPAGASIVCVVTVVFIAAWVYRSCRARFA
ncbi:MAG: anchored repeat-type ABC transporter permease subunit [Pauljensenia sp.]